MRAQIQPITLNRSTIDGSPLDPPEPPHIQPGFYAGVVINTIVGTTGAAQIVELDIGEDNVSGTTALEQSGRSW